MWRFCVTILLLIAFTAQTFHQAFMVMDYYTNTTAFARACENRFRPQMHCNGYCVLMKKLKEEASKDRDNPERKQESRNEVISSRSFFATLPHHHFQLITTAYPDTPGDKTRRMPRVFFHPPDFRC